MIKYYARINGKSITEIEVERETKHCVYSNNLRKYKRQPNEGIYDTFEEAHAFLEERLKQKRVAGLNYYRSCCKEYDKFIAKYLKRKACEEL